MQRITKSIWKTIRPKFSNKYKTANTIILVENNKILQDDKAIANTFINYFDDVTHSLGLKKNHLTWKNSFKNCGKFQKLWECQQDYGISTSSWKLLPFVQDN